MSACDGGLLRMSTPQEGGRSTLLPYALHFLAPRRKVADGGMMSSGSEDQGATDSIQKSRSCNSKGKCAESGRNQEPGFIK